MHRHLNLILRSRRSQSRLLVSPVVCLRHRPLQRALKPSWHGTIRSNRGRSKSRRLSKPVVLGPDYSPRSLSEAWSTLWWWRQWKCCPAVLLHSRDAKSACRAQKPHSAGKTSQSHQLLGSITPADGRYNIHIVTVLVQLQQELEHVGDWFMAPLGEWHRNILVPPFDLIKKRERKFLSISEPARNVEIKTRH